MNPGTFKYVKKSFNNNWSNIDHEERKLISDHVLDLINQGQKIEVISDYMTTCLLGRGDDSLDKDLIESFCRGLVSFSHIKDER